MAIAQTSHVREILFVRPTIVAPWAIHQKRIYVTTGAPFPIADAYGEAEPLALADVGDILDSVVVDMAAERDGAVTAKLQAEAALDAMTIARENVAAALSAANLAHTDAIAAEVVRADGLAAQVATAQVGIAELTAQLATAQARIAELESDALPAAE